MSNPQDSKQRDDEVGALWRKRGEGRADFFTGSCICGQCGAKQDIVVFENNYKKADNQPEFRILKSRPKGDSRHAPSTRRDEQEQLRDPKPPSRFATLGGRPAQAPTAQWPPRGQQANPKRQQPAEEWDSRNNAKGADDWTANVPHPVTDEDIPF
jgi:hypothetical protein